MRAPRANFFLFNTPHEIFFPFASCLCYTGAEQVSIYQDAYGKEVFPMIYYVNVNAPREGNGSRETPFRHIDDAARAAMPAIELAISSAST